MVKTNQILTSPAPGVKIGPIYEYTAEQTSMLTALRAYADTLLLPAEDAYYPWELRWLNKPDTIPRYMRAAKWKLDDAQKRLKSTVEWRRDFKPDLIVPDDVKIESESGKIILNGFDNDGRPILYMRPGRENTERSDRQLRHLVWCLERAKDFQPPGQESVMIIVDYKSITLRTNPSISIALKVLNILQHHYVETLGRAVILNLPMLFNFFFKGISPFLDPVTRDKMRFNPNPLDLIPADHLDADLGGTSQYEFEPESYWTQLVSKCKIAADGTRISDNPPANEKASSSASLETRGQTAETTEPIEKTHPPVNANDIEASEPAETNEKMEQMSLQATSSRSVQAVA